MVKQESKYRCVFVMSKSFPSETFRIPERINHSRVYKSRSDVDRVINKRVRFNGRDASHLAEPSNALRKKEHLADYWIYLC